MLPDRLATGVLVEPIAPRRLAPGLPEIGLADDTTRPLSAYLGNRWKDTEALFSSRPSDQITTQAARNMLKVVAREGGVKPFLADGGRGKPEEVTPHALRHGAAFRMINAENGNTLYDVWNRLRHQSITTTERVYEHILER